MAKPQLPGASRPTYFGGTPTNQQGYSPATDERFIAPDEDFSPDAQRRREISRFITERPLSTAAPVDYGAVQFAENYGPYEGPDNMGVPQIAAARYRSAQAVVRAGMTKERAETLQQYPALAKALVSAGMLMLPQRATDLFPEGDPRAAANQAARMQQQGFATDDITEEDVARLLNTVELEAAGRRFLTAADDPIRQQNILASLSDIERIALFDVIQGIAASAKEYSERGDVRVIQWLGALVAYPLDALWWLNRQAVHAATAQVAAMQQSPAYGASTALQLANPATAVAPVVTNAIVMWNRTEPGQFDQEAIDQLKAQYGPKAIDVMMAFSTAQAKKQNEYVWDTTNVVVGSGFPFISFDSKPQTTPLEDVMVQYQDDAEALDVVRQLVYAPYANEELITVTRAVDAATMWNYGQRVMNFLPIDRTGAAQEIGANVLNVGAAFTYDPTLGFAKAISAARVLRFSIFRIAPGVADVGRVLKDPAVKRKFTETIRFMNRYRTYLDEEAQGQGTLGRAANLRAAWEAGNQDIAPILDDLMDWNGGQGVRSIEDVRIFINDANDLERVLAGNPAARVRDMPLVFEKLYNSPKNAARREPLVPNMSAIAALRSRARQNLAVNGFGARRGQKLAEEWFGTDDPRFISEVLSDAPEAIGSKMSPVLREESSLIRPAAMLVGKVSQRKRQPRRYRTGLNEGVPFVPEQNPGRFKYSDNSFAARWDRATRLLSKKPNGGLIAVVDARDSKKIYTLARAFFPKYIARMIEDAWIRGTVGDRVLMHNGLVRSAAESYGVRLRYGADTATALINDLAAGGTARFEKYSPTIIKSRRPDGTVVYKVYGEDNLVDGAFPLSMRREGDEFVNPAEITAGRSAADEVAIPERAPSGAKIDDAVPDPNEDIIVTSPSVFNGREHPVHLYQTADYVRTPDFNDFEQIQQRAGFWSAFFGWADSNPATVITDAWSLGTLFGARFVARSALEDYTMWVMTSGSWTDLYKGRRAGTRLRAFRDAGTRTSSKDKWLAGQPTYWGEGSRLGVVNRRSGKRLGTWAPRDETLRSEDGARNAYARFVLDFLTSDERELLDSARTAMATALNDGDTVAARTANKQSRELLFRAFMRSHGVPLTELTELQSRVLSSFGTDGVLQHLMDDVLEQSAYYNSARAASSVDRTIDKLNGLSDVTMGRIRYGTDYVDLNLNANEPGAFAAWYRSIYGTVNHDGPIGVIGIANLPKYANPRTRDQAIKLIADAIRKDTKWGYKERFAALSERGITVEVFAEHYLDDVYNLFSRADGSFNWDLWRRVAVREYDTQYADRLTIGDVFEPPPGAEGPKPSAAPPPQFTAEDLRLVRPEWSQVDFYDVLRVPRDASEDTIRRAYRQRARETHPDVNTDPMAAEHFRAVQMAYEVLGDGRTRSLYDFTTRRLTPTGAETFLGTTRVPESVRVATTTSRLRVTTDFLKPADLKGYKPADRPQTVLGTRKSPIPSITDIAGMDKIWQVLGAQYNRISKEPIFLANILSETRKLQPYYDLLAEQIGTAAAENRVARLAVDRATNVTLSYTDNPANRTILAWKLRNVARYYRATEDFIRRMMRVTKNYPEGIWKVALTYDVLEDTGFVWSDDKGEKYFLYPMTGMLGSTMAQVYGTLFGTTMPQMNLFEIGGKVSMLMPSTDPKQTLPTLTGPVGVLLPAMITNLTPEFDGLERVLVGEYGAEASFWDQVIPAGVQRVLRLLNQDERLSQYGQVTKSAMQIAVAAGLEPRGPNGEALVDEAAQGEFRDSVSTIAQTLLVLKAALGFIVPASPQLIPADVTTYGREMGGISMNRLFRAMIDDQGDDPMAFENALVKWYSTYGREAMPYTVSQGDSLEGMSGLRNAAVTSAYSRKAFDWASENRDVVNKFPVASTYLFPQDNEFEAKMYSWWRENGYKTGSEFDPYFRRLVSAAGQFEYAQTERYLTELQAAGQPYVGDDGKAVEVTDDFIKFQLDSIKKRVPYLEVVLADSRYTSYVESAENLINGDVNQAGEMRRLIDYYYSPDFEGEVPSAVAGIAEAIATFDYWKSQRDAIVGQTNQAKAQRAYFDQALQFNLDAVGAQDPNAAVFITRVLKPLAKRSLYAPGDQQIIPSQALLAR